MLEEVLEVLTKQMLDDRFNGNNPRYIISRDELYKFCIKLVKIIKSTYGVE